MKLKCIAVLITLGVISSSWTTYLSFNKVSMNMETRTAKGGYTSKINARIYYSSDGKMITYYDYPREYIIFNNAKGEIKVYNVKENTVILEQNFLYSTETTQLYYFLQNNVVLC